MVCGDGNDIVLGTGWSKVFRSEEKGHFIVLFRSLSHNGPSCGVELLTAGLGAVGLAEAESGAGEFLALLRFYSCLCASLFHPWIPNPSHAQFHFSAQSKIT